MAWADAFPREQHIEGVKKLIEDIRVALEKHNQPLEKARIQCPVCKHHIGVITDSTLPEKWVDHDLAGCGQILEQKKHLLS